MTKFINIPAILLIALISLSFSCGQQDSSSPVTQETNQNELDLSDFGEPYSAPGTARTYPDIFTLFDTSLEEFATPEEGKEFCTDPANLGSIFRYPNPESEQTFEYESCVGVHLESKTENSRPSLFRAFKSEPNFFRQFSGIVHITYLNDEEIRVSCKRLPGDRASTLDFKLSDPLTNLCGPVFAFKFNIDDSKDLKAANIIFAAGDPENFSFGQFR